MQVLKFVANINSVYDIYSYGGFVYYSCVKSLYLYKCNSMFERVSSFQLDGEVKKFVITSTRIFIIYYNDKLVYIYDLDGKLLSKVDIFEGVIESTNEQLYMLCVDINTPDIVYISSSNYITKLSTRGDVITRFKFEPGGHHIGYWNGFTYLYRNNSILIYNSKFQLYNTIDVSNYSSMIYYKCNIHVIKGYFEDKFRSYKIINKDGDICEFIPPNSMKINSFILSNYKYLYVRMNDRLLIYENDEIVGMTKSCNGFDIEIIFYVDNAHYFRIYNNIYRLVDFNWGDYNSLDVLQRESIENWLDFRPLSPIHRDIMLLFARELINI